MMDDNAIVEAIRKNENRKVLKELYKSALPSISDFVRANGGSKQDAEDCFQEAVIGFIASVKSNRFSFSYSIRNYLFGIARNKWFDEIRRKKRFVNEESIKESGEELLPEILSKEKTHLLNELVRSIGDKCAQLLKYVIYENKKHAEIKELLDFNSEDVVKATYYRCKQKLRDKVKETPGLSALLKGD